MIKFLLGWLPKLFLGLADRFMWRRSGVEAERQKRLQDTLDRVMEREELEKDIRREDDDDLVDRLAGDRVRDSKE